MLDTKWLRGSIVVLIILEFMKPGASCSSSGTIRTSTAAGWHLIVPPFVPGDPPGPLQLKAPLSQWTEMDSAGTAADCEEQRNNMTRMSLSADIISPDIQFEMLLYHYAVCVSSSDPRLRLRRDGHKMVHSFGGSARHDRVSVGYTGPPVEQSPEIAPESPEAHSDSFGIFEDPRTPIMLMLLGFVLMATAGPLGGWLREKTGFRMH